MEVSTVSSAPPSPIEGDDLCEIDFSNVAIHSVTLFIGLCGLSGNGAILRLLRVNITNLNIFDLAVIDFLLLLFVVPSALLFLVEDVSCSIIMPLVYLRFLFQVPMLTYYWALWRLTSISIVMELFMLCLRCCCCCDHPWQLVWVMDRVKTWAFFIFITVIPTVTSLCPSEQQEQCQVVLITMFTIILVVFAAPNIISRSINFIKAKCGSQQQQLKRIDIVTFLIVLFTLLIIIWNFLQQLGYIFVSSQVVFLLTCINSTIKPLIYFLMGRCWRNCSMESLRESLQRVFDEQEDNSAHKKDATTDTVV